jgi:DnaJ domain
MHQDLEAERVRPLRTQVFVKTKERAGRTCFFLCIPERGGGHEGGGKVIEYSVCLGETLNLSSTQWVEVLRASKDFRSVPLEDVLRAVERYAAKHGLRSDTIAGLREAVHGGGQKSRRGMSSERRSEVDEYAAALRLLGLPPGSSEDDIESAFRKAARRYHPDVGGNAAKFRAIVAARNLLLGRGVRLGEIDARC